MIIKNKLLFVVLFIVILIITIYHQTRYETFQNRFVDDLLNKMDKMTDKQEKIRINNIKNNILTKQEKKDKLKKIVKNNRILVTGSTSGIGYYVAKMVNLYKPKLIITGRHPESVDRVVKEFQKTNDNVSGIVADFTKPKGVENLFKNVIKNHRNVEMVLNCVDIDRGSKFLISKEPLDWREELDVNVNSTIILNQKFSKRMRTYKIKGRIINISSFLAKDVNNSMKSSTDMLLKNLIENYSNMLSEEMYSYKIAITTIRIDEEINVRKNKFGII